MRFPPDPNEEIRLAALQMLAITKRIADPTINRITAFTRERFKVPICFVTIIEAERQVILSRQGSDATETARGPSFCTHTILRQEVMIVPDAKRDARFNDNPFVTGEPHIRFYAGAPLIHEGNVALGSLCIIDQRPRDLTRGERSELEMLAEAVVGVIVARAFDLPEPDLSSAFSI